MSKVAIAMSVYFNDKLEYLIESIDSLLNQTYSEFVIFINVDGPVSEEVYATLANYNETHPNKFVIDYCSANLGLATQLNSIINKIKADGSYNFIARMDADDICEPNRISKQVSFFECNPNVSVLGTSVLEFHPDGSTFYKAMPSKHEYLLKNIIKRCPFNHPTVMFNLSTISIFDLKYDSSLMNTQDYYLWVDLAERNYVFANLDEALLKFRVDNNFHHRRGLEKAKNDFNSRVYAMKKLNISTYDNWLHSFFLFILRLSPSFIKSAAYNFFR